MGPLVLIGKTCVSGTGAAAVSPTSQARFGIETAYNRLPMSSIYIYIVCMFTYIYHKRINQMQVNDASPMNAMGLNDVNFHIFVIIISDLSRTMSPNVG